MFVLQLRVPSVTSMLGHAGWLLMEELTEQPFAKAMRPEVQAASSVQLVVRLRCALSVNNYVAFFREVRGAPYLLACLSHAYFPAVRAAAFAAICTGLMEAQQDREATIPPGCASQHLHWAAPAAQRPDMNPIIETA